MRSSIVSVRLELLLQDKRQPPQGPVRSAEALPETNAGALFIHFERCLPHTPQ